ncbi:MAG TPA: glycosyltransferase [Blastocatellia bacterium]|nr:glycosyltransferase [Blastocatellia bacterium]
MIRDQSIICFGGEDWWYHHQHSKNHIMRRLARAGNRVIFVNSISMGLPSLSSPDLASKIKRKLRSYAKPVRLTEEGIVVVSPPVLPFYSSLLARAVNRWLLVAQIKLLMVAFDMRRPILWIAIPTARDLAGRLGERALIYQVSDKYDANQMDHQNAPGVIPAMHDDLLNRADLIYYSGRKLFEEETAQRPEIAGKAKLLEQAVDYEHFASAAAGDLTEPDDIAEIPRPRLGYFGAVDSWLLDQKLIGYVSKRRPDWHWVLIGLRAAPLEIETFANVHYLGSKPYSSMPAYAAAFDVCVLPWPTDNEFVNYGSPIKVREYLATGKPVVITPIYEYERLDGILRISRGYDDFIAKVEDALTRDSARLSEARQQSVRNSTWDARAEEVSRDIEALAL